MEKTLIEIEILNFGNIMHHDMNFGNLHYKLVVDFITFFTKH